MSIWFEEYLAPAIKLVGLYHGAEPSHKHIIEIQLMAGSDTHLVYYHDPSFLSYNEPTKDEILVKYASKINKIRTLIDSRGIDDYLKSLR